MKAAITMMALGFGAAATLDDTTSGTRCAHTHCLEWDCAEWCTCYDETKDGVYADAGCADSSEDTCNCGGPMTEYVLHQHMGRFAGDRHEGALPP